MGRNQYSRIAQKTFDTSGKQYMMVEIEGPTAVHICWDAVINFNGSHKVYSSAKRDVSKPDDGDDVNLFDWSEEAQFAFTPANQGSAAGSKVLHLGNWRAGKFLFEVNPSAGGDVEIHKSEVGDNA